MHPDWQSALVHAGCAFSTIDAQTAIVSVNNHARDDRGPSTSQATPMLACDLSHIGWVSVNGAGAADFLQGYLTCDMEGLNAETGCAGAITTIKGRVTATIVVVQERPDRLLLRVHSTRVSETIEFLKKYAMFARVTLADESDLWCGLGTFAAAPFTPTDLGQWQASWSDGGLRITRQDGLIEHWSSPAENMARLQEPALQLTTTARWAAIDVAAGYVEVTAATADEHLPQVIGLFTTGRISFSKGCYLGQEIVARAQHRGELKRGLCSGSIAATAAAAVPGSEVRTGSEDTAPRAGAIVASGEIGTAAAPRTSLLAVMNLRQLDGALFADGHSVADVRRIHTTDTVGD